MCQSLHFSMYLETPASSTGNRNLLPFDRCSMIFQVLFVCICSFLCLEWCIVIATLCDAQCTANQVYVKFRKQSATYANEESFTLSNGGTVVYTSPALADNDLRVLETCVPTSTNN